jgi:hypothetical protein
MSESPRNKEDSIALYLRLDDKLERTKDAVSDLMKSDLGLAGKIDNVLTEQRLLKERFEEGVSKTVATTATKVNELVALVTTFKNEHEKLAAKFQTLDEKVIAPIADDQKWIRRGLFAVVFLSVFATAMSFLWKYKP